MVRSIALCALVLAAPAAAHVIAFPRVFAWTVRDGLRLTATWTIHAGDDTLELRLRADADGDGRLDDAEQATLAAGLAGQLADLLRVDGAAPRVERSTIDLQGDPWAATGSGLTVQLVARWPAAPRWTVEQAPAVAPHHVEGGRVGGATPTRRGFALQGSDDVALRFVIEASDAASAGGRGDATGDATGEPPAR